MHENNALAILERVAKGTLSTAEGLACLRKLRFDDLGFARIDIGREARCGVPEAIYCEGKTAAQIAPIARSLVTGNGKVLATRATRAVYEAIAAEIPDAVWHETARAVTVKRLAKPAPDGEIAVVCAGTSDLPVAEEARVTAEFLNNRVNLICDVGVAGLHRLTSCEQDLRRANVLIVVAGMEGALASVVAGLVARPVIAVPTSVGYGANFGGLAPLLAMMNSCAPGVAVVNIDNGFGAACIASLINHTGGADAESPNASATAGETTGST